MTRSSAPLLVLFGLSMVVGALHYAPAFPDDSAEIDGVEVAAMSGHSEQLPATAPVSKAQRSARSSRQTLLHPSAEQHNVAQFIAQRYRLAVDQTQDLVGHAYRIARDAKLDPWLVLAVISVESSFNPKAQSHKGAQGLMQVLTRVHVEKFAPFGGASAAFEPLANMRVGTQILKEYLGRAGGNVEGALKYYVGAALLPHDGGYGAKVLFERERIAAAATGSAQPRARPVVVASAAPTRLQVVAPASNDRSESLATNPAVNGERTTAVSADAAFQSWLDSEDPARRGEFPAQARPSAVGGMIHDI